MHATILRGKPHRTEQNKKTDKNYFEYDFYQNYTCMSMLVCIFITN